ncbi:hypothetical protein K505DRAFT_234490 [Melanomma pulvis-pyrius CBS 109.77]|uniref:DUF7730 domain-containing protein n=1 Tax=Melanomma pulvis-pyrius CBS 109.77 TaxID=1314802 RepID=A0A6A6XNG6_9PLEO|nr:hypothetical protein K505DRAFT_234490 [Melanomma pulvis-pyrius CBS 109.77]
MGQCLDTVTLVPEDSGRFDNIAGIITTFTPLSKNCPSSAIIDRNARVYKRKPKGSSAKRRDGLLNTKIRARSKLMKIALENSTASPLLRLPGEIRDTIWRYAVGGHQVDMCGHHRGFKYQYNRVKIRPLGCEETTPSNFVRPTFQLLQVCRQIYIEASHIVYTMNTFGFNNGDVMDRWIKSIPLGHKRAVASIDVPSMYMSTYTMGTRKPLHRKFPNIKRIGIDIHYAKQVRERNETLDQAKARVQTMVRGWECENVKIEWHDSQARSRLGKYQLRDV